MAQTKKPRAAKSKEPKRITRYTHDEATDPATPETGHTRLIGEEQVITLPMDNDWPQALEVSKLPDDHAGVIVDMDPAYDPVLFWAGKRNRREIPVLPLQRNEIVTESRIARIIARAREAAASKSAAPRQTALFAELEKTLREDERDKRVEFYTHDEGWKNKLICGDSLQVAESLLSYEDLRGKVQMIYIDPPYGIKYDSNFQQRIDTTKNDERDPGDDVLTIKAFRDTWTLGVHSYLGYLQERIYLCRELLSDTGSLFLQISDEHVHRVRQILDEAFGADNFCALIPFTKTSGFTPRLLSSVCDYLIWYARDKERVRYFKLYEERADIENPHERYICVETPEGKIIDLSVSQKLGETLIPEGRLLRLRPTDSQGANESSRVPVSYRGRDYYPPRGRHWSVPPERLQTLEDRDRLYAVGNTLVWKSYRDEFPFRPITNVWQNIRATGFGASKWYVVETLAGVVERCILMTTFPGDLVFDPTCGSGTTAVAAERFGRRWMTCDTSRVAINIARKRLLSTVFDHYPTQDGVPSSGFRYEAANRLTLKSLAYGLEPEAIDLVDRPEIDKGAVRVCGPFEVMTLGRYSAEDWKGFVVNGGREGAELRDYVAVISRLYRKDAALQDSAGIIHAVEETEDGSLGISIGPISGRVTARQIHDAARDAAASGMHSVHVLGWAFEANVGEVKVQLESEMGIGIQLVMIRPDSLAEGLKITKPETLFSPLALPDVAFVEDGADALAVSLRGVEVFERKHRITEYKEAGSGYVAAWYLDEDYDGDCFVDCQMFFDFKKKPAIERTLKIEVDPDEWELRLTSDPFTPGKYSRIAVKVVDVYGNESTVVKDLP